MEKKIKQIHIQTPNVNTASPATNIPKNGLFVRRICLNDFLVYQDPHGTEIKFVGRFVWIKGKMGAGKSVLFDAFCFVVFGKTPRSKSSGINKLCKPGGFVEVEFDKNGHLYTVRRGLTGKGAAYMRLAEDGRDINGNLAQLKSKIIKIIGVNYDSFTSTVWIVQDDVKELVSFEPSKRSKLFRSNYRLGALDRARELADKNLKDITGTIAILTKEQDLLKKMLVDISKIEAEKATKIDDIHVHEVEIDIYNQKITDLSAEKDRLLKIRSIYDHTTGNLHATKLQIKKITDDLDRLIAPDLTIISTLKTEYDQLTEYEKKRDLLLTIQSSIDQVQREIILQKQIIQSAKSDAAIKLQKYSDLVAAYPVTAQEIYQLIKEDKASYDEMINAVRPVIYQELKDGIASERDDKIQKCNNDILLLTQQLTNIQSENSELLKYTPQQLQAKIRGSQEAARKIDQLKIQNEHFEKTQTNLKQQLATLSAELKSTEISLKTLQTDYDAYKKVDTEFNSLIAARNDLKASIDVATAEIAEIDRKIENYNKNIDRINEIEIELTEKITMQNVYKTLKEVYPQFQSYCLSILLQDLSNEASFRISQLTSNRYPEFTRDGRPRRYSRVEFPITENGGVDLLIDGFPLSSFSGGEKTLIAMAIRISLSIQLTRLPSFGTMLSTLFIDEGDIGSLDIEGREMLMTLLRNISNIFERTIVISHIDGLSDDFDQELLITMADGGYPVINETEDPTI